MGKGGLHTTTWQGGSGGSAGNFFDFHFVGNAVYGDIELTHGLMISFQFSGKPYIWLYICSSRAARCHAGLF